METALIYVNTSEMCPYLNATRTKWGTCNNYMIVADCHWFLFIFFVVFWQKTTSCRTLPSCWWEKLHWSTKIFRFSVAWDCSIDSRPFFDADFKSSITFTLHALVFLQFQFLIFYKSGFFVQIKHMHLHRKFLGCSAQDITNSALDKIWRNYFFRLDHAFF